MKKLNLKNMELKNTSWSDDVNELGLIIKILDERCFLGKSLPTNDILKEIYKASKAGDKDGMFAIDISSEYGAGKLYVNYTYSYFNRYHERCTFGTSIEEMKKNGALVGKKIVNEAETGEGAVTFLVDEGDVVAHLFLIQLFKEDCMKNPYEAGIQRYNALSVLFWDHF